MAAFEGTTVFHKVWYFLRTYILTLKRFDLFLQGSLLIIILLEGNCYILLRRDAGTGYLSSFLEEWVFIASAGADFLLGAALAWWGRFRRNLALSIWLLLTALGGLLVLAFPYKEANVPLVDLCGGNSISAYTETITDYVAPTRITLLIITALLCSLTRISIWAHGMTYLDDHDPQNGPYYYGILISIRLSLGLSAQNWLRPGAFRDDWWQAHVSLSMLTLMFAILFRLFPKKMPDCRVEKPDVTGFFTVLGRILRNKVVAVQTCALVLLHAGLFCFIRFDSKYVQANFHIESVWQDPRTSRAVSEIFRALVVIFFVMIFRVRFSARRSDGVKANTSSRVGGVVAIFVAVFFAVLAILHCDVGDIEGMQSGMYEQPDCSRDCGCKTGTYGYTPVCDVDTLTTYFSPCSAGCNDYEDLNGFLLFHNCTCGSERERFIRGSCTIPSCQLSFNLYQFFFTVVVAVGAAAILMQGMVILRAVRARDKAIAIGVSFAIISLLSHGVGHLLYMMISYLTCAYEGSGGPTCIFHKPTLWTMAATSSVLALLSAVVSIVASKLPGDTEDSEVIESNSENL